MRSWVHECVVYILGMGSLTMSGYKIEWINKWDCQPLSFVRSFVLSFSRSAINFLRRTECLVIGIRSGFTFACSFRGRFVDTLIDYIPTGIVASHQRTIHTVSGVLHATTTHLSAIVLHQLRKMSNFCAAKEKKSGNLHSQFVHSLIPFSLTFSIHQTWQRHSYCNLWFRRTKCSAQSRWLVFQYGMDRLYRFRPNFGRPLVNHQLDGKRHDSSCIVSNCTRRRRPIRDSMSKNRKKKKKKNEN